MVRPPPRRGTARFGAKSGELVWDTHDLNGDVIMRFDEATINRCKLKLREVAQEMQAWAKVPNRMWHDHPERHPSSRWPSSRTARQGLFAFVQGKRVLRMGITHNPATIWVRKHDGARFNYGIFLETGIGRAKDTSHAIIEPALNAHLDDAMRALADVMNNTQGDVPDWSGQSST